MHWYCASCGCDLGNISLIAATQHCPVCFGTAFSELRRCEKRTVHGINCTCLSSSSGASTVTRKSNLKVM
jgi:hypothetical protein